jgi:hypothetical protein
MIYPTTPRGDMEPKQIFIVHDSIWDAMRRWAKDHKFRLVRLPDGADDEGRPFFKDDDPDVVPTYGFMPVDDD